MAGLVVAVALGYVIQPLLNPRSAIEPSKTSDSAMVSLATRRRAIYQEMLELELDYRIGKLDEHDYRELSDACLDRAASLLREEDDQTAATEERAERDVAAMRETLRMAEPDSARGR